MPVCAQYPSKLQAGHDVNGSVPFGRGGNPVSGRYRGGGEGGNMDQYGCTVYWRSTCREVWARH